MARPKTLEQLNKLEDSDLDKMKKALEVQKLSQEIKSNRNASKRGWIAIIISVITITSGFVGIYRSYHAIKAQNEAERKAVLKAQREALEFRYNSDMLTVLKDNDNRKFGVKMLQYFNYSALPLLTFLLEETENPQERKVIIEIIRKTYKVLEDTVQKTIVFNKLKNGLNESFIRENLMGTDPSIFIGYLSVFDKLEYPSTTLENEIIAIIGDMKSHCDSLININRDLEFELIEYTAELDNFLTKHVIP